MASQDEVRQQLEWLLAQSQPLTSYIEPASLSREEKAARRAEQIHRAHMVLCIQQVADNLHLDLKDENKSSSSS